MRVPIRRAASAAALTLACAAATVGLPAAPAHAFATYWVTRTGNSGTGTLRDAINDANSNPGIDSIAFALPLPATGPAVIIPTGDLPAITEPVIIAGYTERNAKPATATSPATLTVVIDGTNLTTGLSIQANGSVVSGLDIRNVTGTGISVVGDNNIIRGDYVGVDDTGTSAAPNTGNGISVNGTGNWVGGPNPADRDVVSGNGRNGVTVDGTDNHVVGNRIGTSADGTARLGNGLDGLRLDGGAAHVGGTAAGAGNLISGNGGDGIEVAASADGCDILGNLVGVNADATGALPNGTGLELHSDNNTVGGTAAGAVNVLSGNTGDGLVVDVPARGNTIQGNLIGVGPGAHLLGNRGFGVALLSGIVNTVGGTAAGAGNTISGNVRGGLWVPGDNQVIQGNLVGVAADAGGVAIPVPNQGDGIRVFADDVLIGGDVPGAGNTISANAGNGVTVGINGADNPILGNSISDNAQMEIDLLPFGPNGNDPQDGDTGANDRQNFPIVGGARSDAVAGTTTVLWSLNSTPGADFRLEFFAGPTCDAAATTFLGSIGVTTGAMGNAFPPPGGTVLGTYTAPGTFVIATATEITAAGTFGSTSEFSNCVPV